VKAPVICFIITYASIAFAPTSVAAKLTLLSKHREYSFALNAKASGKQQRTYAMLPQCCHRIFGHLRLAIIALAQQYAHGGHYHYRLQPLPLKDTIKTTIGPEFDSCLYAYF
jgi:hypothetical protein